MVHPGLEKGKHTLLSGLHLPRLFFGTSGLGNLCDTLTDEVKYAIIEECVRLSNGPVAFDTAGKYGAGLAMETLGKCLRQLNVSSDEVIICSKLGWLRTELKIKEPGFESEIWKCLKYDMVQQISYDGILECFDQSIELLGGYIPQMVAVDDPDEYFAKAKNWQQKQQLYEDILDAFEALYELKHKGKVKAIGVAAKDWKMIKRIAVDVPLDWICITGSLMIQDQELLDFVDEMNQKGVHVINSAVLHSGFLTDGGYFDYKEIKSAVSENDLLLNWKDDFFEVCEQFAVQPAAAYIQFALQVPGVKSITLNATSPGLIEESLKMVEQELSAEFWEVLLVKFILKDCKAGLGVVENN